MNNRFQMNCIACFFFESRCSSRLAPSVPNYCDKRDRSDVTFGDTQLAHQLLSIVSTKESRPIWELYYYAYNKPCLKHFSSLESLETVLLRSRMTARCVFRGDQGLVKYYGQAIKV
jgi:hypothetical protein